MVPMRVKPTGNCSGSEIVLCGSPRERDLPRLSMRLVGTRLINTIKIRMPCPTEPPPKMQQVTV